MKTPESKFKEGDQVTIYPNNLEKAFGTTIFSAEFRGNRWFYNYWCVGKLRIEEESQFEFYKK